MQLVEISTLK